MWRFIRFNWIRTVLVEHNAAKYRRRVVYIYAHVLYIYIYIYTNNNNKNNNNII